MGRRLWFVVPVAFAVLAVAAALVAVRAGGDPAPPAVSAPVGPRLVTPVLSARRVGPVLSERISALLLRPELDKLIGTAPPGTCLSVVDPDGQALYEHQPDRPVIPASTQKLLTATAALDQLGPDARFRTRVVTATPPDPQGVVHGDVWLVGGGDPLLSTTRYADHFFDQPQRYTSLGALADTVAAAGVTRIDGRILGDESRYDALRVVPSWSPRFAEQGQVGPMSAITVNDNVVDFRTKQLPLSPDGDAVPDPPVHAADEFVDQLRAKGVAAKGTGSGTAPGGATELAGIDSPPLREIVGEMLAESDNLTAELLTKELGLVRGSGPTTAGGVAVIKDTITRLGLPVDGLAPVDGSGLDDTNRETCRILVSTLTRAQPGSPLQEALAVANRTGTLTTRFGGSPVAGRLRAKTGSLNGSSALAGVLPTAKGATVEFAFVQNGDGVAFGKNVDLVNLLDTYPAGPSADQLSPVAVG